MQVYLTLPVGLPGSAELGNEDKTVPGKILPNHVIAYHPGYGGGTFIYLTTGQAFLLMMTVEEYEKAVEQYWLELGKAAARKIKTFNGGSAFHR